MPKRLLHITNGDSAAHLIEQAGVPGAVLPWRDVLHDGPVPGGLSLERLSDVRAGFLAHPQMGGDAGTRAAFAERDACIRRAAEYEAVQLWFEHDLYDQLQLLQILDCLASSGVDRDRLRIICIDRFPGIEPFYGLGQLSPSQMATLQSRGAVVSAEQLALGRRGWSAFTAASADPLRLFAADDLSSLPFLAAALRRFMEDYPWVGDGLPRSERRILQLVARGEDRPVRMFGAWQRQEAAPFLGDLGFWQRIGALVAADTPLLTCHPDPVFRYPVGHPLDQAFKAQRLALSDAGRAVLAGQADALALNGIDRWYGGVRLKTGRPLWRWNPTTRSLQETGC